jgi:hypothetical protein
MADSLARPGGNMTGVLRLTHELSGKRLDCSSRRAATYVDKKLMKETTPKLSRVAVLGASANNPGNIQQLKEIELAAEALKVKLQYPSRPKSEGH